MIFRARPFSKGWYKDALTSAYPTPIRDLKKYERAFVKKQIATCAARCEEAFEVGREHGKTGEQFDFAGELQRRIPNYPYKEVVASAYQSGYEIGSGYKDFNSGGES